MVRALVYTALFALAVPALAARLGEEDEPEAVVLKGVTSQGGYAHLTLTDGRPTYFAAGLSARCDRSRGWWNTRWASSAGGRMPLTADGDRLMAHQRKHRAYSNGSGDFDVRLRGSFGPRRARGEIDYRVVLVERGRRTGECRVSGLRWTARAKP